MVNSQDVFNKIMCIDALIDLEAIIPSLSELQLNLSTSVQQFRDCLELEDPYFEHSENFCRLLCIYLDKIILKYTDSQQLSWAPYLLENYFYGFDREPFDITEQLTFFSSVKRNAIFLPAYQMTLRLSGLPEYKTILKPVIPLFEKRLPLPPVADPVPPPGTGNTQTRGISGTGELPDSQYAAYFFRRDPLPDIDSDFYLALYS